MKSIFEEMDGTYRQVGDYFIPNLVLPDDGNYQIGKYGRIRRSYLKEHHPILYNSYMFRRNAVQALSRNRPSLQRAHGNYRIRHVGAGRRDRSTQSD